jgi:predicted transposase YdaD
MTDQTFRQLRGTDETFLLLMQLSGAGLLKLAGFPPELAASYEFRAVEFKEKQLQRPDVEGLPILETATTRVTIEFQGYADPYIRYRCLNHMLQICLKSQPKKPVVGIIVYTEAAYQAKALALKELIPSLAPATDSLQELVLTDYTEAQLVAADPRLIVLAPFTVAPRMPKVELRQQVVHWRAICETSYPTPAEFLEALNIIGLLLLNRFRDLSHQEIIDMLNLDLMASRAGREIYQLGQLEGKQVGLVEGEQLGLLKGKQVGLLEGKQVGLLEGKQVGLLEGKQVGLLEGKQVGLLEGKQAGLLEGERLLVTRLLKRRFGELPTSVTTQLANANSKELERWGEQLLNATSLEQIFP